MTGAVGAVGITGGVAFSSFSLIPIFRFLEVHSAHRKSCFHLLSWEVGRRVTTPGIGKRDLREVESPHRIKGYK